MGIVFKEESYKITGACFEVYKEMGCGFLESVYQECLKMELQDQQIPFVEQSELKLFYKERLLKQTYRPDFICYDSIVVELKAVTDLTKEHQAQLFNYLRATNLRLGLLVNFGHYPKLEYERIVI
ncbi:MAG TPA: GxxExxY protein [Lentisphaeria bacterium]|nr:MAG: GTP-binding protein [Lentisphaerae bacterium GWF2_50_93]HCE46622.1 GxxExxY protein [Lentisphaeria bacterium]